MQFDKIIMTADLHTAGEPVRVVLGGSVPIRGETMHDRFAFFQSKMDSLRTILMHEPRGHRDMCGVVITPPVTPKAQMGLLFFDTAGYLHMCGHSTIGAVTLALELGMVEKQEPHTDLTLDTVAGSIHARARVEKGMVKNVTFRNVPSFLYAQDIQLSLPEYEKLSVDIAFGGNFFAIVDSTDLDIPVNIDHLQQLVNTGLEIRKAVNEKVKVRHPTNSTIVGIDLTLISAPPQTPRAHARNVTIFSDGQFDRSPCGTGTSAKMASLYAKGNLALQEPFIHESIIGTIFEGRLVETTEVGTFKAVVPEITGSAYITGFHQFVLQSEDPLKQGFHIS
jgi:proline racemase